MASKKVEMYAKKRYELDEIKNKIKEEFDKRKFSDVEFKDEIIRELGDTKTLLLIFENWFLRTGSYASLVIMLSEYQGYQSADIIATGSDIEVIKETPLFEGLGTSFEGARYHSLAIDPETIAGDLTVTAVSDDGEVMAVEDSKRKVYGVQFHPESILTPKGGTILSNFLQQ